MNLVQAAGFPFSSVGLPKTWASFGAQSFKIDAVFEMHRKNADAVVRATFVVLDGLNRMTKRQGELLAAAVGEHIKVAHDVLTHVVRRKCIEPGWRYAKAIRLERFQFPRAIGYRG